MQQGQRSGTVNTDRKLRQLTDATDILSYKWQPKILYVIAILEGATYSEIKTTLGNVSSKMLSEGLEELRDAGIVRKSESIEGSGVNVYHPTMKGRELILILRLLIDWQETYSDEYPQILIGKRETVLFDPIEQILPEYFYINRAHTPEEVLGQCTDSTDIVVIDEGLQNDSSQCIITALSDEHEQIIISLTTSPPLPDGLYELPADHIMVKPLEASEFCNEITSLRSRTDLTESERQYLALRSKQAAVVAVHGASAESITAYQECEYRIKDSSLSPSRQDSLDGFLSKNTNELLQK